MRRKNGDGTDIRCKIQKSYGDITRLFVDYIDYITDKADFKSWLI